MMVEPQWGYASLKRIVALGTEYSRLQKFYPIGADIFVFVYPIFLTLWYLKGIFQRDLEAKKQALFIFLSCVIAVAINIASQQFFDKQRPIYAFGIEILDQETLLHSFLPTTSFPSDHAVVTFSVAMATLLIWLHHRKKSLQIWSVFLFIFAIITGICRIGTTVHWTTDILAGMIVGLIVPLILIHPLPYRLLKQRALLPLIKIESWILKKVFGWREEAPIKRGAQTKKTDKN